MIYTIVGLGRYYVTAVEDVDTVAAAERDSISRDASRAAMLFRKSLAPRAPKAAADPRKTARPRVVGISAPTQNFVSVADGDCEYLVSNAVSDQELIDGVDEWDAAEIATDQRARAGVGPRHGSSSSGGDAAPGPGGGSSSGPASSAPPAPPPPPPELPRIGPRRRRDRNHPPVTTWQMPHEMGNIKLSPMQRNFGAHCPLGGIDPDKGLARPHGPGPCRLNKTGNQPVIGYLGAWLLECDSYDSRAQHFQAKRVYSGAGRFRTRQEARELMNAHVDFYDDLVEAEGVGNEEAAVVS